MASGSTTNNTDIIPPSNDQITSDHPLFLLPTDHPGLVLISKKLAEPNITLPIRALWERNNDMIISWILNTMVDQIGNNMNFTNSVNKPWPTIGIKSLHNAASITVAHIRVSAAQELQRKMLSYKVNAAEGVNAASEEVSTAELMIDYALWEVIENGATLTKTQVVKGVTTVMPITFAEDKAQRRLEDAKKLLEAVKKRFGGNAATKKTQRNLLKQQYENFTAPSSEMLNKTFDRLQKLMSQLVLLDEKLSQEDVYEPEVKGMSSSSSSTQNMAFVSSSNNNTSSTNEVVNAAHGVTTASTQVNTAYSTNIDNLSDAV
ncbi:hypothetical protein Tco_1244270 [Tanacetum coccineum]